MAKSIQDFRNLTTICMLAASLTTTPQASAGIFNTPHFIMPKDFALGIEPEVDFRPDTNAAVGINFRGTYGISEMNNLNFILGTGGGERKLRVGGNYTIDLFPDAEKQPGIGLALQALFVRLPTSGSVELTAIPYIHKSFVVDETGFEPFIAVPLGISLYQGKYTNITTLALGSLFQHNDHFRSVFELGFGLGLQDTYISGGLVYYH